MPSVIRINGRLCTRSPDYRAIYSRAGEAVALAANTRRDGLPCDGTPIPPESPDSAFRVGVPYKDDAEDVAYRVVTRLNVTEGWGTASFWMRRWRCHYADVLAFVRKGWLDAAIEEGSSIKRFRCRDEHRVRASLEPVLADRAARSAKAPKMKAERFHEDRRGFRWHDR